MYQEDDLSRIYGGAWEIFQRLLRRVEARESSYDYQILRPSGSVDDKAGLVARVTEI